MKPVTGEGYVEFILFVFYVIKNVMNVPDYWIWNNFTTCLFIPSLFGEESIRQRSSHICLGHISSRSQLYSSFCLAVCQNSVRYRNLYFWLQYRYYCFGTTRPGIIEIILVPSDPEIVPLIDQKLRKVEYHLTSPYYVFICRYC